MHQVQTPHRTIAALETERPVERTRRIEEKKCNAGNERMDDEIDYTFASPSLSLPATAGLVYTISILTICMRTVRLE